MWSPANDTFLNITTDIVEQKHYYKNGSTWNDYLMFFKIQDPSAQVTYVKIIKIGEEAAEKQQSLVEETQGEQDRSLSIKGFTENGEVLFQYVKKSEGIDQSFGMNVKKYNAARKKKRDINRTFIDFQNYTE